MAKRYYKKNVKKKSTKEIPVCGECLIDPTECDLKNYDFYWVLKHNPEEPLMDYFALYCKNCIEELKLIPDKPYQGKPGRKKKAE